MNFFKNGTATGLLCVVLSLVTCLTIAPMFNRTVSKKAEVVRVTKNTRIGDEITEDTAKLVEVDAYNLPESAMRNIDEVIGKYTSADMVPGDYITCSEVAEELVTENTYPYNLNGGKQAIFVSARAFANGLSGRLVSGDAVSVVVLDYRKQGSTVTSLELQHAEVIVVTTSSGYDVNTGERGDEEAEKKLPGTATPLVTSDQGRVFTELEADRKLYLSLVYRGIKESVRGFVETREIMLEELYPLESEKTEENTEKESGIEEAETVEETGKETV